MKRELIAAVLAGTWRSPRAPAPPKPPEPLLSNGVTSSVSQWVEMGRAAGEGLSAQVTT